jgi:hypothetical protein
MDERKLSPRAAEKETVPDVAIENRETTAEAERLAASAELAAVEDDLMMVDDDIATLPLGRQEPLRHEATTLHADYDSLMADVSLAPDDVVGVEPDTGTTQSSRVEKSPDQPSGESSIVFKPRDTVPTLYDTRCKILEVPLNPGESSLSSAEVASRLHINPAELLQRYNDMMEAEFNADPWNKRTITPDDVMAWGYIDTNIGAIGDDELKAHIARYVDKTGKLSPKEVTRILGNQRLFEEDADPTNLYATIERAKAARDQKKKR